jgi:phage host-nuclease inhibitor protein Gam
MNIHFDVERLRHEIRYLVNLYPELEEDGVLKADMIEAETSFAYVMDMLIRRMREAQTMSLAVEDEMAALAKRQQRFDGRVSAMRDLMFKLMEMANQKKIERPIGTVSIVNGRPHVVITDEAAVMSNEKYVRVKREIDKRSLEIDLKAGDNIPGAALSNAQPRLRVS